MAKAGAKLVEVTFQAEPAQLGGGGGGRWLLGRLLTDIGSCWTHCSPPNELRSSLTEHFASDCVIDRQQVLFVKW